MRNSSAFPPLRLGDYPTPVEPIPAQFSLAVAGRELWVKRDDRTHAVYGGNKVRKLEWLLAGARACGAKRLVTLGAAGSHHVLATTYFGRREGFDVEAVLVPQPRTAHAVDVLRASLGLGLRAFPVRSWGAAPWAVARRMTTGARFISVGGSSVLGSMGYVAAAHELAEQIRAGDAPKPDVVVVALGSGGTAAGLAAGLAYEGLATRVVGVCVSEPQWLLRWRSSFLLRACSRRARAGWNNPGKSGRDDDDSASAGASVDRPALSRPGLRARDARGQRRDRRGSGRRPVARIQPIRQKPLRRRFRSFARQLEDRRRRGSSRTRSSFTGTRSRAPRSSLCSTARQTNRSSSPHSGGCSPGRRCGCASACERVRQKRRAKERRLGGVCTCPRAPLSAWRLGRAFRPSARTIDACRLASFVSAR